MSRTNDWYKDAIIYELHVRAFHDSVGDGYGDFRGLTQKLDYLEDLGVTAIWILPFYPSPLRDDGYDIADYRTVHPQYGTLDDFKYFLDQAHQRNMRVITELVINHTSDQHPWFQRARLAPPGSPERNYYVWSDTPDKYPEVRIIFKDFERSNWTWDPVAKQYYWHRFYHHQPDLNYDNPAVWDEIMPLMDYWFSMGVDGMRLDAIPYLYEREGTNCESLPETHGFLKALRKHVDERFPDRMFLAEANQWPEDSVAYFGDGDECHMAFHFPLMPRLFMALHQEDRFPIIDILEQTPPLPDSGQWCLFLRNHDELTLEMVTDEERDYMYRAYTRDRQARINAGIRHRLTPLLRNDRRRIELMYALLFALPGTPAIYYGDEIGMGDNIYLGDRNGVRTPMQWSADRNAGFSRANPQKLYLPIVIDPEYHYEAINVEAQQNNPSSLLWWMKRLISLRKQFRAFGRGTIEFLRPANAKVLAFVRQYQDEIVLVVANLSRFVQHVELDLSQHRGLIPEELFGRTAFPKIDDRPYLLTTGPHGFYWFRLRPVAPFAVGEQTDRPITFQAIKPVDGWLRWLEHEGRDDVEAVLPDFFRRRASFGDHRVANHIRIQSVLGVEREQIELALLLVHCEFTNGMPEMVPVVVTRIAHERADHLLLPISVAGLAQLADDEGGLLCDALAVPECGAAVLQAFLAGGRVLADADDHVAIKTLPSLDQHESPIEIATIRLHRSWRNNIALVADQRFMLKLYRRLEDGISPDLELSRYLVETKHFPQTPSVVGHLEYRHRNGLPMTMGVLYRYVPNQGDGWQYTLDHLSSFFERVAALSHEARPVVPLGSLFQVPDVRHDDPWPELSGGYEAIAQQMGDRTAELHLALADNHQEDYRPEAFSKHYQRSIYQSTRTLVGRLMNRLNNELPHLPASTQTLAKMVLDQQDEIADRFRQLLSDGIDGYRIRIHSDYHLGQLLHTGKDFCIIDFEGDPTMTLAERRLKRSPLRDVASMIRSFDYAADGVLLGLAHREQHSPGLIRDEDRAMLQPWSCAWYRAAAQAFLNAYTARMSHSFVLPTTDKARRILLECYLLEKSLQEVEHELNHRRAWVVIPLRGVLRLIGIEPALTGAALPNVHSG